MVSDEKKVRRQAAQYDLFNRLHSIRADCGFVREVAENWFGKRFEVVPNQRCGTWYCDPSTSSAQYAYFKSTDGHTLNWDFNLRRSNLALASHAQDRGGLILVDSTRRGKRMPDALSKTVPIWCAVVNRAVALTTGRVDWDMDLYTPAGIVAPTEKAQIEALLATWVQALVDSNLVLPELKKPLRPFFIHPSTSSPPQISDDPGFVPLICLSASRWIGNAMHADTIPTVTTLGEGFWVRREGFDYVPGAGDDDELWSRGLTPALFHQNKTLLRIDRDDLAEEVDRLVRSTQTGHVDGLDLAALSLSSVTPITTIGNLNGGSQLAVAFGPPCGPSEAWSFDPVTSPTLYVYPTGLKAASDIRQLSRKSSEPHAFALAMPSVKAENRVYLTALRNVLAFARTHLQVACGLVIRPAISASDDAKDHRPLRTDLSDDELVTARKSIIPILLVLLCESHEDRPADRPDKTTIAGHLQMLVTLWPDSNPPRAALKRVNEVLLSPLSSG